MTFLLSQKVFFLVLFRVATSVVFAFVVLSSCYSTGADAEETDLWMHISGEGDPTVVFISGNGNDSSVWADIAPRVRDRGARTVVYDRAGLGRSDLKPGPYRIDYEANALEQALSINGVGGPMLLVAHSYGGLIATLVAENNPNTEGIVFVDAILPNDLNDAVVANVLAEYAPQFSTLEEAAPALARAVIPVVRAYPETAKRMQTVTISPDLPFIDIVAERSWMSTPEELAHIRRVHADFAAASPARTALFASGSGHNVMRDRPDIIIQAISQLLGTLSAAGIE